MDQKNALEQSLQLFETLPENTATFEEQRALLIAVVNDLIHRDFSKLLQILYRIDVDEQKLKTALFESPLPVAETISDLIIERQLQKIKFRAQFENASKK